MILAIGLIREFYVLLCTVTLEDFGLNYQSRCCKTP